MTRRDVLEIKITALLFGFVSAYQFLWIIKALLDRGPLESSDRYWMILIVFSILVGVASVVLISLKWGGWIAKKLLPGEDPIVLADLAGAQPSIFLLALKCAGVPLLFLALSSLSIMVIRDLRSLAEGWSVFAIFGGGAWVASYMGDALCLALALYLLFGGKLLVRFAVGSEKALRGPAEPGETPATAPSVPQMGTHDWEEPLFVLALRIIAVVFLVSYSSGLLNSLVLQWVPALRPLKHEEMDWDNFLKSLVTLGFCIYLLSGGRHLVDKVFRKKVSETDAGAAG